MDFKSFLLMGQEIGLITIFLILFCFDIVASGKTRSYIYPVACILFFIHTVMGFLSMPAGIAFGGMYQSSSITILMKNILNLATLIIFLQSHTWLKSKTTEHQLSEFFTITLVTLLGMYLMISARNFMMLYIGMETASLPLACLAAFNKYKEKSAEAGVKYVLISAFSSGIMLFGLSFIYGSLGTFYFDDLSFNLMKEPLTILGFVFFFAGLGFKLSLVPFHLWTADVYEGAPTSVTAYLSVVSKAAAAFALILALYKVFGNMEGVWQYILWWLAVITITIGNLFAIRQKDIKRFFAFSSISQAGYILLGIITGTAQGMTATIFYVLVYLFSNLAAFGVIAAVENASKGNTLISTLNGLYKNNPKLSLVMMLAVFSLGGIPPLAGFFSKFFIFMAAASEGFYILVFIALLNTVVSLYYYLLIIKAMFIKNEGPDTVIRFSSDVYNKVSLVLCTLGIFIVGLLSVFYDQIHSMTFGV